VGYLRFRRRFRLAPGVYANLGKGSASLSVGGRGHWVTTGTRGRRATVGIPGTGLWYTTRIHPRPAARAKAQGSSVGCLGWIVVIVVLWLLFAPK
jgi:hypothetical protein